MKHPAILERFDKEMAQRRQMIIKELKQRAEKKIETCVHLDKHVQRMVIKIKTQRALLLFLLLPQHPRRQTSSNIKRDGSAVARSAYLSFTWQVQLK